MSQRAHSSPFSFLFLPPRSTLWERTGNEVEEVKPGKSIKREFDKWNALALVRSHDSYKRGRKCVADGERWTHRSIINALQGTFKGLECPERCWTLINFRVRSKKNKRLR